MFYGSGDELYDMANEVFDEVVFSGVAGDKLLEQYNDLPDDGAREMLFDIVHEMQDVAKDAVREAMERVAKEHKGEFVHEVRQKWACPDCSDQFEGKYVMLTRTFSGWECPKCGCSTCAPKEDGCYDMTNSPAL